MAEQSALVAYLKQPNQLALIAKDSGGKFGSDRAEAIVNGVLSTLAANKNLWVLAQTADGRMSVLQSVRDAVRIGLIPGTPLAHAYLVPFKGKITMMVGYRGWITLLMRSGLFSAIEAYPVHEKDEFEINLGTDPKITHKPFWKGGAGNFICAYSVVTTKDGHRQITLMTLPEIEAIRARSESYKSGKESPWKTDFDQMALKTVIRRAIKQVAIEPTDEIIRAEESETADYIEAEWSVEKEESGHGGVERAKAAMKKPEEEKNRPVSRPPSAEEPMPTPVPEPLPDDGIEWQKAFDECENLIGKISKINPNSGAPTGDSLRGMTLAELTKTEDALNKTLDKMSRPH